MNFDDNFAVNGRLTIAKCVRFRVWLQVWDGGSAELRRQPTELGKFEGKRYGRGRGRGRVFGFGWRCRWSGGLEYGHTHTHTFTHAWGVGVVAG